MIIITGGYYGEYLASTEVMAHPAGSWRDVAPLPSIRSGLRGATLAGVFHISGGYDADFNDLDEILAWDPVSETWSLAGHLTNARGWHGVTEVSIASMAGLCTAHSN